MAPLLSSRLSWLLVSLNVLCAGQSERATAMQWADYYAAVYRVPPELVQAIIEVESAWQPRAVSKKGAVGLMQLMPSTAANFGVTNRFEIEQNIRGGVAYLARLLKLFNGDLRLVAAAYVAGEGALAIRGTLLAREPSGRTVRPVEGMARRIASDSRRSPLRGMN